MSLTGALEKHIGDFGELVSGYFGVFFMLINFYDVYVCGCTSKIGFHCENIAISSRGDIF